MRPTLVRWLERRVVRPITGKATRPAPRGLPVRHGTASSAAAGAASPPSYRTGGEDYDVDEDGDLLEEMDDLPGEAVGRPPPPASRHSAHPPETRGRGVNASGRPPPTAVDPLANHHRDAARREERHAAPTRRIITAARRPHSGTTAEALAATRQTHAHLSSSPRDLHHSDEVEDAQDHDDYHSHGGGSTAAAAAATAGAASAAGEDDRVADGTAVDAGQSTADTPPAAKSSDAYRFLLHHIDAEIAALQRRHASVTTRRQSVQTRQTQRIKDLFDVMESPWTLLPTDVQPALPATGVDVYIKEQQLARQQQHPGQPTAEGHDKMYVLALHKNYKSMPAGRKRFYEEAAHFNAAMREELRYQLTRGCSRFETFLDTVKECTMDMAREGRIPELPSSHAQNRFHAARSAAASNHHGSATRTALSAGGADAVAARGRRSHPPPAQPHHAAAAEADADGEDDADGDEEEVEEEEDTADEEKDTPRAAGRGARSSAATTTTRGRKASQRIKSAAKKASAKTTTTAAAAAAAAAALRGRKGSRPSPSKAPARAAPAKKSRKGSASGGTSKQKSGGPATASVGGVSRSIPLPNLDRLAMKKMRKMVSATPSGASSASTAAAGGSRGKTTSKKPVSRAGRGSGGKAKKKKK